MRRMSLKTLQQLKSETYLVVVPFSQFYSINLTIGPAYRWLEQYQGLGRYYLGNGYEEDTQDDGATWGEVLIDVVFSRREDAIMFKLTFGGA